MVKVFAFAGGESGTAFHRIFWPCQMADYLKLAEVVINDYKLHPDNRVKSIHEANVIVYQLPASDSAYRIMDTFPDKAHIVEIDDNVFDIDPYNYAYAMGGLREVSLVDEKAKEYYRWEDGKNGFNLKANNEKLNRFKKCLAKADAFITTNDRILQKIKAEGITTKGFVYDNYVDIDLLSSNKWCTPNKQVRVGYHGGVSHFRDFQCVRKVLEELPHFKDGRAKFVFFGSLFNGFKLTIDFENHGWVDPRAYAITLKNLHIDIGLCPLIHSGFNVCKSPLKFREYASLGCAVVASDVEPYNLDIDNGVDGILTDNFSEPLKKLIEDENYRKTMGITARTRAERDFNLANNVYKLVNIWEEVFNEKHRIVVPVNSVCVSRQHN